MSTAATPFPRLLLLFGMSRSGTSWIGKIFDSHPLTLYKHEPDTEMLGVPLAPSLDQAEDLRDAVSAFVTRLPRMSSAQVAARLPVFRKQYRSRPVQQVHRLSVLAAIAASSLHRRFPVLCAGTNNPDVRYVWKSVISLGRLGVILRVVPDCRAIRIIRHPCGYVSSVLRGEAQHKFLSPVPASEDYGTMDLVLGAARHRRAGLTLAHLRQLHPVERLAWIWVLLNDKAAVDTQGDQRCTAIRYEDVCRDPEGKSRQLFSFCGLPWDEQAAQFVRVSTLGAQATAFDRMSQDERRYYGLFRDPVRSAEKWRSEMKADDIGRVYNVVRQSDLIGLYPESEFFSDPAAQPLGESAAGRATRSHGAA